MAAPGRRTGRADPRSWRLPRSLTLGIALGAGGAVLSALPPVLELDENVGLGALFALRGPVPPPADLAVVSISRDAARAMGQSDELDEWPRSLHAELIDRLVAGGAAVIAFDVTFLEPREGDGDQRLADAVLRAGNVLLAEHIETEPVPLGNGIEGIVEKRLLPLPELKAGALGTAPFVLPRIPLRVGQFWTFGRATADTPSLPAVALQAYLLPQYEELVGLMERARPGRAADWPQRFDVVSAGSLEATVQVIRAAFQADVELADLTRRVLERERSISSTDAAALGALIDLYAGPSSRYLNFYGPARTVRTIPYDRVLETANLDIAGKIVFVGFAETRQPEQQDDFISVFSQRTGINLSGVEVGATAFANLLDQNVLVPLPMPLHLLGILTMGVLLGLLLGPLATRWAAVTVAVLGAGYSLTAYGLFVGENLWLPLVVPLFVLLPAAFAVVLWWNYRALVAQRERVHTALGYYVPRAVARRLADQSGAMSADRQLLHGTCMFTDAEHYTAVSEALRPDELAALMNDYYRTLFGVVERYGGEISDTAGDSMVAVWASARPDAAMRESACRAALAVLEAVGIFNREHERCQLPTTVGLESGELVLGNIGAEQRYEYRAIGDIVNTASRIQGLNRVLGTRVLVSAAALAGASGLPVRDVGTFLLRGKRLPMQVHEPLAAMTARLDAAAIASFAAALDAFRGAEWGRARREFGALVGRYADDGPSAYYQALAAKYEDDPPATWTGAIHLAAK